MENTRIRIALTDDHIIVRKGFRDILSLFGEFEVVIEADNGEELLQKLRHTQPDVCILDISMPVKNGYETIIELRKSYPGLKILILSMFNNEFAVLKMLRNGANGYLLKNCHPNDLKTALTTIHAKGYYHSDFVTSRIFKILENKENIIPKISDKEMLFLKLCCRDLTYKEMADIMKCSPRTAEGYRDALFHKLNVRTRTALAMYAIQIGIVPVSD